MTTRQPRAGRRAGPSPLASPSSSRRIVVGVRHKQILDKLAIGQIPATVEDEVARLAGTSFIYAKHAAGIGEHAMRTSSRA